MELRILGGNEIQPAVNVAVEVFYMCVMPFYSVDGMEQRQFHGYINADNLWRETSSGRLILWGVYDGGQLCGVGAMQSVGHIVLLSVRRECQGRGFGTALLRTMMGHAFQKLHLKCVTVNVQPKEKDIFFLHQGFYPSKRVPENASFKAMECIAAVQTTPAMQAEAIRRAWLNPAQDAPRGENQQNIVYGQAAGQPRPGMGYGGGQPYAVMPPYGQQRQPVRGEKPKEKELDYPVRKLSTKTVLVACGVVLAVFVLVGVGVALYHIMG